ncbi:MULTISPECIES: DUF6231 family protein [unclassified Acinetobacter]|uniref:DUF6231 family protein n=1 Tax=unclassified Acinetobacter TaxID=196816 RepID=UPI0029344BCD|nr:MULTISPECIES: DUF6231 family protein [unclassified Acinetobacter]WOE31925.1 DUF6231 family protein [Acinetobacter sp. SAAs470]WOE37392.1 DUF6231 family protein [Acinetobacter sp. SAAs474]
MAERDVITSMLDDLFQQQPVKTALCIGQHMGQYDHHLMQWQHFSVSEVLSLPFTQRYDLALVWLDGIEMASLGVAEKSQCLVKLRDLWVKRIIVIGADHEDQLLKALGFTSLLNHEQNMQHFNLWQFNILTYKQVPDWLNAKFWANPENWNKYRW